MASIFEDIKRQLLYSRDTLMRFILVNIIVFLVIKIISVIIFLFSLSYPLDDLIVHYLAVPAYLPALLYRPWTIITYMFLHEQLFHILFNMLVLYWFGQILIEYLGSKKFIYTYFLGGIAGAVLYIIFFNIFPAFGTTLPGAQALGASASIMAIVFATATLLPDYSVRLLFFGDIKLKYIAIFYLVIDIIGIGSINSGGHIAHLGGALFGFTMIRQLRKGNDWANSMDRQIQKIRSLFKRKSKIRVDYINANKRTSAKTKPDQAVIDNILDKISKSGYESLSKEEKEILFKASKN
jgi:membrane associated rhomboid family serine protease